MVAPSSASSSLKEYLKKYESDNQEEKKKQKKKKKVKPSVRGVIVVDEDPVWQKPVKIEDEEDDSAGEELPQVDEDIEVKRMKRLEQLKARRPFGAISEDGSGWVSVPSTSNNITSDNENFDLSPPRKRTGRNDTPSPKAHLSPPPRARARNDTPSPEPQLKPSSTRDSDISPPRKKRVRNDTPEFEMKPLSTKDVDISPPRRRRARNDTPEPDVNPLSTKDVDISPPRRRRAHNDIPEPDVRCRDGDISPPRRHRTRNDTLSPEPRAKHYTDLRAYKATDLSPPRKASHSSDTDLSPQRKAWAESSTMKQGPKTGLVSGKDIKEEIARTKKEDWIRFKEMDPLLSGKGAEAVYRDKITGEPMSKEEYLQAQKKKKEKEKPKEIKLEWGKGLAQKRELEARLQELENEKDKPFARSRDDPELDKTLKERLRWGDPMAHLVKKKQLEALQDFGANEKMKESGFIIPQEIPSHSWIKRGLDAAPNRYGIRPGRHWDGVDRSTGYEKQLFKRMNEKQATEREAYLWSVSDM